MKYCYKTRGDIQIRWILHIITPFSSFCLHFPERISYFSALSHVLYLMCTTVSDQYGLFLKKLIFVFREKCNKLIKSDSKEVSKKLYQINAVLLNFLFICESLK